MKILLIITFLSIPQIISAQFWPTLDDCTEAEDKIIKKSIEISPRNLQIMEFNVTTKGNGVISVPGMNVRIYDAHDDGLVFENYLLKCEWKDTDADGFLDLVVSGTAILTGDQGDAKPTKIEINGVFRWDDEDRRFEVVRCSPEIYTWASK